MKKIIVKKENGSEEFFNEKKIRKSLQISGVSKKTEEEIILNIKNDILKKNKNLVSSTDIYKISKKYLKQNKNKKYFLRYNLTQAVSKLGPEGFAFEKFISFVFKAYSYSPVFVGKKIKGKCVIHEMDIVAHKKNELLTAELKFHNSRSKKTDLKVALYMKARFDDILNSDYYGDKKPSQLIITNTKFTDNAKKYSSCAGIDVLSWNYPEKNNLHDFILNSKVHPITALETVSKKGINYFLENKIVTLQQLISSNFKLVKENPYISKDKFIFVKEEIGSFIDCLACKK